MYCAKCKCQGQQQYLVVANAPSLVYDVAYATPSRILTLIYVLTATSCRYEQVKKQYQS